MNKRPIYIFSILYTILSYSVFGQSLFAYNLDPLLSPVIPTNKVSESFPPQDTSFSTVAVLGFTAEGLTQLEAQVLSDRFAMELEKTNAIQALVLRETTEEIISERGLADGACRTDSCVVEIGNMLGVDFLIRGHINNDNGWYTFEVDMLSVENKRMVEERKVYYNGDPNGLVTEMELLAWNLVNRVSPRALYEEKAEKAEEAKRIAAERAEAERLAAAKRLRDAKIGALWRSTIMPGWGQRFLGKKKSGWVWLGSELAIGSLAIISYSMYKNAYNEFEDSFNDYNSAIDQLEIASFKAKAKTDLDKEYSANDQLKMVAAVGGAVWIANIIHAYLSNPVEDISNDENTGFDIGYDPNLKTPKLRFYIALD